MTSLPLWRQRDFLLLWSGQSISLTGTMVSAIARPFLVFQIGGAPREVGIVLALSSLPFVFLALPAGAWIDRWDRKRTMILSDTVRGVACGVLVLALLLGRIDLPLIYGTALLEGMGSVFFTVAETSSLAQVVGNDHISAATNYNQATFSIASLVAAPIGGILFALNPVLPFGLDALSFLISVVALLCIAVPFQKPHTIVHRRLLREIREGVMWLWREPLSRYLTLMNSLMSLALGGSIVVIIRLVARALPHAPLNSLPAITGSLLTFGGFGGIVGVGACGFLLRRFSAPQLIAGSLWLQGAVLTLLVVAPGYVGLAALFVASYMLWPVFGAAVAGYRLARIPDMLQGRVNAVYRLMGYAGDAAGAALHWRAAHYNRRCQRCPFTRSDGGGNRIADDSHPPPLR